MGLSVSVYIFLENPSFTSLYWASYNATLSTLEIREYYPDDWLRADSRFAPGQWETALLCNDVSHFLGASLESAPLAVRCVSVVSDNCALGASWFLSSWNQHFSLWNISTEIIYTSNGFSTLIVNHIHIILRDVICHPCPKFNSGLPKPPLKWGHMCNYISPKTMTCNLIVA